MKFAYTIIYVPDVQKAIEFYEKAFNLTRRFIDDTMTYGELETEGTTLSFASNEQGASNLPNGFRHNDPTQPAPGIEIAFTTDDVKAAYKRAIDNGATKLSAPETKPWGQDVAYVRDIHGVLIEICTPIGG